MTPSWPELITLMIHGPDLPLRGRIHHDDGGEGTYLAYGSYDGDPGPVIAGEGASGGVTMVWRDGDRLRLESADGHPSLICDGETVWSFRDGDPAPRESPSRRLLLGAFGTDILSRGDADRWRGDDFTRPAGPVVATTFLGRQAWSVELVPPRHQPHPLTIVIDAETGMLLQQRADEGAVVSQWTELVVGEPIDAAVFGWAGPVVTFEAQRAERRATDLARERDNEDWAREHLGVTSLLVELRAEVRVLSHEPDGSFHAEVEGVGQLDRRPRRATPWEETDLADHTWSDDTWDWSLHSHRIPFADGALQRLQAQLGSVPVAPMTPAPDDRPTTWRPDGDPAAFHRAVAGGFTAVVEATTDWDAPAPVEGWTARDVVRHLVEWLPPFLESGAGIAIPSGPSVDVDPAMAWRVHTAAVQALLDDPPSAELVLNNPHLGEMALSVAVSRFYTADVFMHTWDLATATGQAHGMDEGLAGEMLDAMETSDEMLRASGQFGAKVEVPADADAVSRLMGFVGRRP